ncbi:MAG: FG-GAP-like repeat-containing protein [Xanthobacteraceae bacterium]
MILLADGTEKPIEAITAGDLVMAFDGSLGAHGRLVPRAVTRTFQGLTDEWVVLRAADVGAFDSLTVTPSHRFLAADGGFRRIEDILQEDRRVVLTDGSILSVTADRLNYSTNTAHLYENGQAIGFASAGNAALAPQATIGWRTYNFEVEGLHTYVAGGVRVHNECNPTLSVNPADFLNKTGHEFSGSQQDIDLLKNGITNGDFPVLGGYVNASVDGHWAPFDDASDKIVLSVGGSEWSVSTVSSDFLQHITSFPANGTRIDTAFAPGILIEKKTDLADHFDWDTEITSIIDNNPVNKIVLDNNTVISSTYAGAEVAGNIGAVFGSNLGKVLGGNSLIGQVAAGTLAGAIGKEIGKALFMSASFSVDAVVTNGLANVPGGFVGGLPGAAVGALANLLIGEVANALPLGEYGSKVFQGVSASVTNQLVSNAFNVATQQINQSTGLAYTLFDGFNTLGFAANVTGVIGGVLGSTLAAHVVLPHYPEGAVGQQIGASIGGAIGAMVGLPGGPLGSFIGSAVGSFVGGAFGTAIGDFAGNDPQAYGELVFDAATHRFTPGGMFHHDHGGDSRTFYALAQHQAGVINAMADFAGGQLDGMQVIGMPFGYITVPEILHFRQDGREYTIREDYQDPFILLNNVQTRDDLTPMADAGIMQVLHHTRVYGGDPLVMLAWQNSHAENASGFAMDLQAAKDYRTYLDDKPMIDALMAAEPESSFTLGWLLTLLKTAELGLDETPASEDFRAGNDNLNGTAAPDFLVGGAGGDTLSGGDGNDRLRGGADNDALYGGNGNDILLGEAGGDWMYGGPGDDTYVLGAGDWIEEYAGQGTDTVYASVSYALRPNVENLVLLDGTAAADGAGNALVNRITGNANGNWLDGAGGADTLTGGRGNDTYVVYGAGETVSEESGEGYDTVRAWANYTLAANVETLFLLEGSAATDGIGNALANWILGNANENWIDGKGGADTMQGGLGVDTYVVDNGGDVVIEYADQGIIDTIRAFVSYALPANVEDLILMEGSAATDGAGNELGNWITGNANNNWLGGLGGNDVLIGGAGNDTFVFAPGTGADVVTDFMAGANSVDRIDLAAFGGIRTLTDVLIRAAQAGSDTVINLGNGDSITLQGVNRTALNIDDFLGLANIVTGDFNGDGRSDVLGVNGSGALHLWEMNGTSLVGGGSVFQLPAGWQIAGVADFNGDGKADILGISGTGALYQWLMDGNNVTAGGAPFQLPAGWHVGGLADFNGDHKADILGVSDTGSLYLWQMDGAQISAGGSGAPFQFGAGWHLAGLADFNGDGKADILGLSDTGALWQWQMDGTSILGGGAMFSLPAGWRLGGLGDFNGDGKAGILGLNDAGALHLWEMNGTSIAGGGSVSFQLPAGWHIAAVGDFNGDGKAGILGGDNTGAQHLWEMNGTAPIDGGWVFSMLAGWHVA